MFKPKVGDHVRLKFFESYRKLGLGGHEWAHFEVTEVGTTGIQGIMLNGAEKTTTIASIPMADIEPPFGYQDIYTVEITDPSEKEKVLGWFPRGIAVWVNHDLSSSNIGGLAFTPGDLEHSPHWKYTGKPVEILSPEECQKRIRILWFEEHPKCWCTTLNAKVRSDLKAEGWKLDYSKRRKQWSIYKEKVLHEPAGTNC